VVRTDTPVDRHWRVGSVSVATNQTTIDQTNEGDEQTDTHGDGGLERWRNRVEDHGAKTGGSQNDDDDTVDDHEAHGLLPGHALDDRHGEERVDTQTCGQRERQASDETEQQRHHTGGECGCASNRSRVRCSTTDEVARNVLVEGEDDRVQDDDVDHRHEDNETATELSSDG